MLNLLNNIRTPQGKLPLHKQVLYTFLIMSLGVVLGIISKYLDCRPANELPSLIDALDLRNFLSRFAIWLLLGVCISIYSKTPISAAINTFVFFAGMVVSYYVYSQFIAGFFPKSYVLIWVAFTIVSPLLAFICWYAKGQGKIALIISSSIIAILFNLAFSYGLSYFDVSYSLEVVVLLMGVILLSRSLKQTFKIAGYGISIAIILNIIIPFQV